MRSKSFDAVEMKRRGQEAVRAKLEGMSPEEEVEFWKQRTAELRQWQEELRARRLEAVPAAASPVGAGKARP